MRRLLRGLLLATALVAAPAVSLAQAAGFVATVTAESTDLRMNANDGAQRLDTILRGTKLQAFGLSPDKKWVRVKAPDGSTVWIARADVKVTKGEPPPVFDDDLPPELAKSAPTPGGATARATPRATARPAATPGTKVSPGTDKRVAHVIVAKTRVLLNPTKSAPMVATASKNDVFEVGGFSKDKLWIKVRTKDGRIGWIAKPDARPGLPSGVAGTAVASATPRSSRPKDDFYDPNAGFSSERPAFTTDDAPVIRRRPRPASDMTVWADAGIVLINQKVTSDEGHGYSLGASGYGAGVRFERRLFGGLFVEGGYLGTANQRIPAPESTATIFSTLHRIDVSARYKYEFIDEEGPSISAIAGFQNYNFLVQPQNLSWFYSQIYTGGAIGLGGEYGFGATRLWLDGRYLAPVLMNQRYGSGGAGGDGQSSTTSGFSVGLGAYYRMYSGGSVGLGYRGHFYDTQFSGVGVRGPNRVSNVRVVDSFQAVTLTYARGF